METEGHIEFRKAHGHKFYAPDRDILHVWNPLIKAALKVAAETSSEEVYNSHFKELLSICADLHNKAMTLDTVESIIGEIMTRLSKLPPELATLWGNAFIAGIFSLYVNALRDGIDKPVLSDEQLTAAVMGVTLLGGLPSDERVGMRPRIAALLGMPLSFANAPEMYAKLKKE